MNGAKINIGYDARILAHPKCGISTYLYNLALNLLTLEPDINIYLFSDQKLNPQYDVLLNSPRVKSCVFASADKDRKKWAQKYLPGELKVNNIALYHAVWNNAVPFFRPCPCVLTVHDLIPWVLGGHFKNPYKELRYKIQHFICAQSADRIITDSFKSKEDIARLCRVSPDKVAVVYLGVEKEFTGLPDDGFITQILKKYQLDGKKYFIDIVGLDHLRRNPIFVLEAFNELIKRGVNDYQLVYTGKFYPQSKEYKALIAKIDEFGLKDKVVITGWIATDVLRALLVKSLVSIIPSLYEGFGLPILESYACSVPVIATDCGSIPEVASDAALFVKPGEVKDLTDKVIKILDDPDLKRDMVKKGLDRIIFFDWKKCAQETLVIYKNII